MFGHESDKVLVYEYRATKKNGPETMTEQELQEKIDKSEYNMALCISDRVVYTNVVLR